MTKTPTDPALGLIGMQTENLRYLMNEAYRAVQRVRELHKPYNPYEDAYFCGECFVFEYDYGHAPYPCPTIQALEGDN